MPHYGRYRSRVSGEYYNSQLFLNEVTSETFLHHTHTETCADTVGNHFDSKGVEVDHDFLHESVETWYQRSLYAPGQPTYQRVDGEHPFTTGTSLAKYPIKLWTDSHKLTDHKLQDFPAELDHLPVGRLPLNPALTIIARTNPGKPAVDIPAFIGELRDIPRLLEVSGKNLIAKGGSATLSYQFGWKPLIHDLSDMINFGVETTKVLNIIKKMLKGGISRQVRLGDESAQSEVVFDYPITDLPTYDDILDWKVRIYTRMEVWGTARWFFPEAARLLIANDSDLQRWLAISTAYGLSVHPASAWELLPWSWMIDWFANFQNILELVFYRALPVEFGGVNVCTKRTSQVAVESRTLPIHDYAPWYLGVPDAPLGFRMERVTKRRDVSSDLLPDLLIPGVKPLMSSYQWSILTALAAKATSR